MNVKLARCQEARRTLGQGQEIMVVGNHSVPPSVIEIVEIPRVGPLGLVHQPEGYEAAARDYPTGLRVAASFVLSAFVGASIATTAYSLGAYCLTTWAGNFFVGF